MNEGDHRLSQQEFMQEPQFQQQRPEYEQETYNSRSSKAGAPKDEPPSSYDEPMTHYDYESGYQAQDSALGSKYKEETTGTRGGSERQQRQQQSGPDGDAFEHSYRGYNQYNMPQGVPPWARPQLHRRSSLRTWLFIVLSLMLIIPILRFLLLGLAFAAGIIGIVVFTLALLLLFAVLSILITFRTSVRRRQRQSRRPWHGPWGW